ncbi:MAG TPA: nitroreductase family protein [Actinomycetota bacterium]|nr:nitroreductase family protein [Actinomycetota bacterium]
METWESVRTRRNVRRFADRPIPPEHLDRIVTAAALAPSSMNEQRWAFVVCRSRERLEALSRSGDYAGHVAAAAAAIAFLTPRVDGSAERESIAFDLGQAVENAMLVAWELGVGSCHASVYDEPLVRELLGYPDDLTCDLVVSFGYPTDPTSLVPPGTKGGRRPVAELRHDETFGG